jgi:predicted RNase H-like HicB family nuclease
MTYGVTMSRRQVHVIVATVERDETGAWGASADMPRGGANGVGFTREETIADLREALALWLSVIGIPEELALDLDDDHRPGRQPVSLDQAADHRRPTP